MSSMVKHLISASMLILPFSTMAAAQQPAPVVWQQGTGGSAPAAQPMNRPLVVPVAQYDPSEGNIPAALQRWKMLSASGNYAFGEYASFLMTYPDWPNAEEMRKNAEEAINPLSYSPSQAVAYFDKLPPLTNAGRAKYAIALDATGDKVRAETQAREAWRSGPLTDDD